MNESWHWQIGCGKQTLKDVLFHCRNISITQSVIGNDRLTLKVIFDFCFLCLFACDSACFPQPSCFRTNVKSECDRACDRTAENRLLWLSLWRYVSHKNIKFSNLKCKVQQCIVYLQSCATRTTISV